MRYVGAHRWWWFDHCRILCIEPQNGVQPHLKVVAGPFLCFNVGVEGLLESDSVPFSFLF
jgi:hypothetical protein